MYTLGALLLAAILLGAVVSVIDSVLRLVGLHGVIAKIPVVGAHWGLLISILMVWLTDVNLAANWGLGFKDDWMVGRQRRHHLRHDSGQGCSGLDD